MVTAADTDSPVVIAKVAADGDRMTVTLLNTAPYTAVVDGWQLSTGETGTTLPAGSTLGGFARTVVTVPLPAGESVPALRLSTSTGETVQLLEDPAHRWAAGDIFSLHGVDRYRYVVVYSQDTDDDRVHGCYEVDQDTDGDWIVSQFVHGQEVFADTFMVDQGARYLDRVSLDNVTITDTTPGNEGQSYFGRTLGSLFNGVAAPGPSTTPEPTPTPSPVPTAPHWPVLTPTPTLTVSPSAAPTPGETPQVTTTPGIPNPTPEPSATGTAVQPVPTELTPTLEPNATGTAVQPVPTELISTPEPTLEPAPATTDESRFGNRRYAGWSRPDGAWSRHPVTPSNPSSDLTIAPTSGTSRSTGSFARPYHTWSWWTRS